MTIPKSIYNEKTVGALTDAPTNAESSTTPAPKEATVKNKKVDLQVQQKLLKRCNNKNC